MMGDNRNHSLDARFRNNKFVSHDAIIAKAKFTIFPFTSFGSLVYAAEDAALILADEPFAGKEPDNEVFCGALQLRIERFRAVAAAAQKELLSGKKV